MKERAPITVLLPNYNHAHVVGRALRAVLAQTIQPEKIVVVDDGSDDGSVGVIEGIARDAPAVTLIRNSRNQGVEQSMESALALCDSPYFSAIAAPDELLPGFIASLVPWIRAHPAAGLYLTDFAFRGSDGRLFPKHLGLAPVPRYLCADTLARRMPHSGYILPAYGCVFRTEAVRDAGGFRPQLRWHADWFVELVLACRHGICYVPEPHAVADMTPGNYSSGSADWPRQRSVLRELLRLLESPVYADVASWMERAGALAYFGSDIVRAAHHMGCLRRMMPALPFGAIFARDARRLLVRVGPEVLRRQYWAWRYGRSALAEAGGVRPSAPPAA